MNRFKEMKAYAHLLKAMAAEGRKDRANERVALALLLESQARCEALLIEYTNRADVAIAQNYARRDTR